MQAAAEDCRKTKKDRKWDITSTQQSLSESMNIDDVDKIILPELHYNHAAMEQYYFGLSGIRPEILSRWYF